MPGGLCGGVGVRLTTAGLPSASRTRCTSWAAPPERGSQPVAPSSTDVPLPAGVSGRSGDSDIGAGLRPAVVGEHFA